MPLQATSGAASYDAFGGGVPIVPAYIEEVFSTWLYTGSGANRTITNGIDLSTNGGLVWTKNRNSSLDHELMDTQRGAGFGLRSNGSEGQVSGYSDGSILSFNTDGYSLGFNADWNFFNGTDIYTYASWTFRKQPKFFDIQTWTGTGANRTISHSLNSVPACIMVKRTDTSGSWQVYHRSLANTEYMVLNSSAAVATGATRWNSTTPTSTVFSLGTDATVNASGGTYVAYIFAHNAGGFGLTGTDNVISCGSFNENSANNITVNLGYEPQYVMFKCADAGSPWIIVDSMRGIPTPSSAGTTGNFIPTVLQANSSGAETSANAISLTSTGFVWYADGRLTNTAKWIYIAIRRGPMKVPTTGTSVFSPVVRAGTSANATVSTSFPVDMTMIRTLSAGTVNAFDRLRGPLLTLRTSNQAGDTSAAATLIGFDIPAGVKLGDDTSVQYVNTTGQNYINYLFSRAPNFLDVVCYTASGAGTTVTHNLGVTPEMVIIKNRGVSTDWGVWHKSISPSSGILFLNTASLISTGYVGTRTSTTFAFLTSNSVTSASGNNYVAYFFATLPGVSKVGNYTGTGVGTTQQIDCGFTSGARFVLIKRASSSVSGGWYVWDTARGIVTGNDPFFQMNVFGSETTNTDYIDPYSAGFEISSTAPSQINESGNNYIFLAIA
jgi:hypothetical protein